MSGVTLLITTYNRDHLLANSLRRLAELTPPDELIVVDDGGTDQTAWICQYAADNFGLPMRYVYTNNPGEGNCCHARNVGIRLASHELLLTCEPEVMFLSDVIPQLVLAHQEFPDDFLHGWCEHEDDEGNMRSAGTFTWREFPYLNLWEKQWLIDVGGWDENMPGPWGWDDIELFERMRYTGHQPRLIEGVKYRHQWHKSRIEPAVENEAYSRSREMPRDLVANKGVAWGQIR